jgi:dTMP kinase
MAHGKFIVLEGIDGAGTTSQLARLAGQLERGGAEVLATREPSDGPIGKMLRQMLSGDLGTKSGTPLGWAGMALLFAADRRYHLESEVEPALARGAHVLSDRYDASSLAYQSVTSDADARAALPWIAELNRYARRPDVTIVLDVPAEVAAERRAKRNEAAQIYETDATQRALADFYRTLPTILPADCIEIVGGEGSPDAVEARIHTALCARFPEFGALLHG